jgi:hypothetical protein
MICPRCGADNPSGKILCYNCGIDLKSVSAFPVPPPKKESNLISIIIRIAIVVILLLGMFFIHQHLMSKKHYYKGVEFMNRNSFKSALSELELVTGRYRFSVYAKDGRKELKVCQRQVKALKVLEDIKGEFKSGKYKETLEAAKKI